MDIIKNMIKLIQQHIVATTSVCILPNIETISYSQADNECVGIFSTKMGLVDTFYNIHYNISKEEYTIAVYNKIDQIEVNNRRI